MSHPIGFYSLSSTDSPLLEQMTEVWGEDLSGMNDNDRYFLIGRIAEEIWLNNGIDVAPSDFIDDVVSCLYQLTEDQKISLIRALVQH